ncbi:MAG: heavy metal translocating P-type ATPase [Treponema sp.]
MKVTVIHALPGRIRVRYPRYCLSRRQAVLVQTLIAAQSGITDVRLTVKTGSLLIFYDTSAISQKEILNLFAVLSDTYLNDTGLLEAVVDVPVSESLFDIFLKTAAGVLLRSLLPMPIRNILLGRAIIPRIGSAAASLFRGKIFTTDLLDATALTTAVISGNIDTARSIATLLTMGEEIEESTKRQSYNDLAKVLLVSKEPAHLLIGNEEQDIDIAALKKGDTVIVRMGEQIPADGVVIQGEALVDQASITGESLPVEKKADSAVFAGTIIQEGELVITVHSVGTGTKVHKIISMIENSQNLKATAQKRSEQFAERIVPFNFLLTALTYLFTRDIQKTISTLMIDYSCAMKLAAPIAVLSAMKEAAENGISVKGGVYLEEAARADTIIFDKTGTLTHASPVFSEVYPVGTLSKEELLLAAACLEEHFPHPLGRAVVKAAEERGLLHPERHTKVEYIVAHGIASSLEGKRICIGSAHFLFEDEHIPLTAKVQQVQALLRDSGSSLLYLAVDGQAEGIIAIDDPVRTDAAHAVAQLKADGVKKCIMITGDTAGAAQKIATACGIDEYHAQALPEDKVQYVEQERAAGRRVIMIGDGINDAPALSAAHAGIAVDGCSSIAGDTADIVLSADGLASLVMTRQLSRKLFRKIERNNAIIVGGNSLFLAAGMAGLISPALAALLHNSLTVGISIESMRKLLHS